jgi:hypothetical protein|tara:strand:- start:132 stop:512 length:381 start_codon:yes stop_codon:yes gene_type:complete
MSNTYSKGDIMDWDEAEYNYFMSLDDMTKVYYLHDYLYGELGEDQFEDMDYDDEPMFDFIPEKKPTTKINVILDQDSLWITCSNHKMMDETIRMFIMDGLMLQLEEAYEDTRHYLVIKHGSPISLN